MCGSVRYVSLGEPQRVTVCHCLWCQRRTGTAFGAEAIFQEDRVRFSGIAPSRHRHVSDESGRWLEVYFCPRCGTNLGLTVEAAPGIRTLPAGTYDDPAWLSLAGVKFRHLFARTRRDWCNLTFAAEVHEHRFR